MLDLTRTRIKDTRSFPILSSAVIAQEGLCLQHVLEDGKMKVKPSTGTSGDENAIFVGISWGERFAVPATLPFVEELTVASGKVTLSKVATAAADMLVVTDGVGGTKLASTSGSPTNTQFKLESNSRDVTVHSNHEGKKLYLVYRYSPTILEAQSLFGDAYPGARAHSVLMEAGVITKGVVYTDQFDTSVNWHTIDSVAAAETIRGGANGRLTVHATDGCSLTGYAFIVEAPTAGKPWLGIEIDR